MSSAGTGLVVYVSARDSRWGIISVAARHEHILHGPTFTTRRMFCDLTRSKVKVSETQGRVIGLENWVIVPL